MKDIILLIGGSVISFFFGIAVIKGLTVGKFSSYYGEKFEPSLKEEPVGFVVVALFNLAILGFFMYATYVLAIRMWVTYVE